MLWVPPGQSSRAPPRAESFPWRPLGPWKPELVSGWAACESSLPRRRAPALLGTPGPLLPKQVPFQGATSRPAASWQVGLRGRAARPHFRVTPPPGREASAPGPTPRAGRPPQVAFRPGPGSASGLRVT